MIVPITPSIIHPGLAKKKSWLRATSKRKSFATSMPSTGEGEGEGDGEGEGESESESESEGEGEGEGEGKGEGEGEK